MKMSFRLNSSQNDIPIQIRLYIDVKNYYGKEILYMKATQKIKCTLKSKNFDSPKFWIFLVQS